jgi:hypothetical protein
LRQQNWQVDFLWLLLQQPGKLSLFGDVPLFVPEAALLGLHETDTDLLVEWAPSVSAL